eukprot:TRINITY_DN2398_c0_g1_i1.p1 TRINITY_DN2398_c0_g1~~TRINITY_DN2398_c0_g1_i1.p1  ORF type:complete len:141 (+),score=19.05 TRINITY_DN2398_c0_g1_i1:86-508(+)
MGARFSQFFAGRSPSVKMWHGGLAVLVLAVAFVFRQLWVAEYYLAACHLVLACVMGGLLYRLQRGDYPVWMYRVHGGTLLQYIVYGFVDEKYARLVTLALYGSSMFALCKLYGMTNAEATFWALACQVPLTASERAQRAS